MIVVFISLSGLPQEDGTAKAITTTKNTCLSSYRVYYETDYKNVVKYSLDWLSNLTFCRKSFTNLNLYFFTVTCRTVGRDLFEDVNNKLFERVLLLCVCVITVLTNPMQVI